MRRTHFGCGAIAFGLPRISCWARIWLIVGRAVFIIRSTNRSNRPFRYIGRFLTYTLFSRFTFRCFVAGKKTKGSNQPIKTGNNWFSRQTTTEWLVRRSAIGSSADRRWQQKTAKVVVKWLEIFSISYGQALCLHLIVAHLHFWFCPTFFLNF